MNKAVLNGCYGGFDLSDKAYKLYEKLKPNSVDLKGDTFSPVSLSYPSSYWIDGVEPPRHCPILVQVVEELGEEADGGQSLLYIAKFESNLYRINEYDGKENLVTPQDDLKSYIAIE
jgi:hypothetical protein